MGLPLCASAKTQEQRLRAPCRTLWVTLAADRRVFAKTMDETSRVARVGGPAAKRCFVKIDEAGLAGRESYRNLPPRVEEIACSGRTAFAPARLSWPGAARPAAAAGSSRGSAPGPRSGP